MKTFRCGHDYQTHAVQRRDGSTYCRECMRQKLAERYAREFKSDGQFQAGGIRSERAR